jgi:hypothetical protein
MSDTKHTQTPWEYIPPTDEISRGQIIAGPFRLDEMPFTTLSIQVASIHQQLEQTDANGRLMAAAPDLLAALQWFIQPDHPIGSNAELIRKFEAKARAAIAKAEGAN